MSTLLKMQKFHPLCSRCIGMYPLQNRWTVLRYLQCYENFSECCTHLILPETALFSPTPTFAKEPFYLWNQSTGFVLFDIIKMPLDLFYGAWTFLCLAIFVSVFLPIYIIRIPYVCYGVIQFFHRCHTDVTPFVLQDIYIIPHIPGKEKRI